MRVPVSRLDPTRTKYSSRTANFIAANSRQLFPKQEKYRKYVPNVPQLGN